MALAEPPLLTVRAWPVNSTCDPVDTPMPTLDTAIAYARQLASERQFRTAVVCDAWSTCWAQFNMLWSYEAPEVASHG